MQAIKLTGHIKSDRTLHLNLPENALEGPAEVIVLMEEMQAVDPASSLQDFLGQIDRSGIQPKTKEEIDRLIADERDSWD